MKYADVAVINENNLYSNNNKRIMSGEGDEKKEEEGPGGFQRANEYKNPLLKEFDDIYEKALSNRQEGEGLEVLVGRSTIQVKHTLPPVIQSGGSTRRPRKDFKHPTGETRPAVISVDTINKYLSDAKIDMGLLKIEEHETRFTITPQKFLGNDWADINAAISQGLGFKWDREAKPKSMWVLATGG